MLRKRATLMDAFQVSVPTPRGHLVALTFLLYHAREPLNLIRIKI
jgi:hypothetical protein